MMINPAHRFRVLLAFSAMCLALGCRVPGKVTADPPTLFSLTSRQTVDDSQAIDVFQKTRLVLVGEHHTDPMHHTAQLAVIRYLNDHAIPVAIGLEMFRQDQQPMLERWVEGAIDEAAFEQVYLDNWNFPWPLYRDIFIFARDHRIPMVGLNVPRAITRQVAKDGFDSLSAEQRGELEGITCNVTPEYRDYIRRAFGAHGHGDFDFSHFCEAQLVWDTAMAINAIEFLNRHPDRTMVLLAGSGHVRKMAIPHQFKSRSSLPFTVLLPQTPGFTETASLTSGDADFIIIP